METQRTVSPEVARLLAKGNELIAQAENYLQHNGTAYSLDEWITIKEYARRFDLKSTNIVSNWISRGIIPAQNIIEIPELNDLKLIKAVPYPSETL
ncbi:hypothetical protein [Arsenicibacter rosenii]|uniref:hypothetical protein n=1 Tax=Arsenicibacter rosenii TaxID=1750698 RepID=UPI0009F629A6|nr:hypothetical protein [Arsenicibacter rosenii]